jgi:hypothetical protein
MLHATFLCAVAGLLLCRGVAAQERTLEPGSRVRAAWTQGATGSPATSVRTIGRLEAIHGDSLLIRTDEGKLPVGIPRSRLAHLEIGLGQRGHTLAGGVIGLLAGGLVGTVAGLAGKSGLDKWDALPAGLGGAAAGALVGGVIGSTIKTERWAEVLLDRARIGVAPRGSPGMGVAAVLVW